MKKVFTFLCAMVIIASQTLVAQVFNVIPYPNKIIMGTGHFVLHNKIKVINLANDPLVIDMADQIKQKVNELPTAKNTNQVQKISIALDATIVNEEGYLINIGTNEIELKGKNATGVFYGFQTLVQIMDQYSIGFQIPNATIQDAPALAYRGLMLDVSRHFLPISFVRKLVDVMSMQKMNNLHLHLTDDQGWRIEIKKYPKLTEIGGFRNGTIIGKFPGNGNTNARYGGFYTQKELIDLVQYASTKFVNIVPEIEMPGHASAAIAAYPMLSTFEGAKKVQETWGVFEDVFTPSENTFNFLQDVIDEVLAIFPSPVIHIGGDECPKEAWKRSAFCQQLMKEKGLKNEHELQSYFIQRMEKYINSKGRQIIGWDEILEGGLAPNAKVMSWRGESGGIEAAKQHHEVIMTPSDFCYFNFYQSTDPADSIAWGGFLPLSKVYNYNPVPAELQPADALYIKGVQANLWTEYISNPSLAAYMLFPRAIALAEVGWTKNKPGYKNFLRRLVPYLKKVESKKMNYATHFFDIQIKSQLDEQKRSISASAEGVDAPGILVYESSNSPITKNSPRYQKPLIITKDASVKFGALIQDKLVDQVTANFTFNKATTAKTISVSIPNVAYNKAGVDGWHNGIFASANRFNDGEWLGYNASDFESILQFDELEQIQTVQFNFFNAPGSWVYLPAEVKIFSSMDGKKFEEIAHQEKFSNETLGKVAVQFKLSKKQMKYIKLVATHLAKIPEGNTGAGFPAWLFLDEVVIK